MLSQSDVEKNIRETLSKSPEVFMHKTTISVEPAKKIQAITITNPRLNPSFPVLWTHTVNIYEHVNLCLEPRHISDTPKTIKRWFYIWLEQRVW